MNIQKIPMRPVICLLLVLFLVMSFFSVSAFADELVLAEGIDSYTPDMIYSIAKAFVPEFTNEDASVFYDYDGYDLDVRCLLYLESSGTLLVDSTELYNFAAFWEEGFSASYPGSSVDVDSLFDTSMSYFDAGSYYFPFSCPRDAVVLSGSQTELTVILAPDTESTVPPETETPIVPAPVIPDSTLSQAVSSNTISSVLDQVMDLLPVALSCIVGFIAIRKGLSFLESILHSA